MNDQLFYRSAATTLTTIAVLCVTITQLANYLFA
jgi:hypothetical protein